MNIKEKYINNNDVNFIFSYMSVCQIRFLEIKLYLEQNSKKTLEKDSKGTDDLKKNVLDKDFEKYDDDLQWDNDLL